ncbi:hypothetical protein HC776_02920 [bacterium]|nr:hypothetical protein [bacterium]
MNKFHTLQRLLMHPDKLALQTSQAGMRLIAQLHLYNQQSQDRLAQFIAESYHDSLIAQQDVDARLNDLNSRYAALGRLKIKQVLATSKHHVIVALAAEHDDGFFYSEIKVEDDYPHKITFVMFAPLQEAS